MIAKQPLIGYTARDSTDSSAILRFNVPMGLEAAPTHAIAAGLRAKLQAITECVLVRQSVVYPFVDPTPAPAAAGVVAEHYGVFVFGTTDPNQYAVIEIAGLVTEVLVTEGPGAGLQIDQAAPAVAGLVAELTNGSWANPFGYILVDLQAAFLQIRG